MAWSYRKNAGHRNSENDVRKAVCNKTTRKTKNEMAGWRVHGPEKDGNKRMERQRKESRGLEAYCKGGQGPPRAVEDEEEAKEEEEEEAKEEEAEEEEEEKILNTKCILIFSTTFVWHISHSTKNSARCRHKSTHICSYTAR